jgi:hypothetical protein
LGNLVSGVFLTGLALYFTNMPKKSAPIVIPLRTGETASASAMQAVEGG